MTLAQRLAKQPPGSLVATKRLMRNAEMMLKQMEEEGEYFEARLKSAEAREAFQAFAERRPPDFANVA
jgi:enoyl-CoA hydratase/carnithine racemase